MRNRLIDALQLRVGRVVVYDRNGEHLHERGEQTCDRCVRPEETLKVVAVDQQTGVIQLRPVKK